MLLFAFAPNARAGESFTPGVDLHTHLRGVLSGEELLALGLSDGSFRFNVNELRAAGVTFRSRKVESRAGAPAGELPFRRSSFSARDLKSLRRALSLSVDQPGTFRDLEHAYDLRRTLTAFDPTRPAYYAELLARVAESYRRSGVTYAEISAPPELLKPAWENSIGPALEKIERDTGVRLRFLLGIRRTTPAPELNQTVREARAAALRNPYLTGVDFLGEEVNPTGDFAHAISELAEIRKARPGFQVRVHAGENPRFPANIKEAIRAGATRIGHGVYGVDEETLSLAKARNVIVEINGASNLALGNIREASALPARRYLDAGVRITIGTDGAGIFGTDSAREAARLEEAGLRPQDFARIAASDEAYKKEAAEAEESFRRISRASAPLACSFDFARISP